MDDGWSIKRLIRRIVLSRAYRLDSAHDPQNFEVDPDNALVWRMSKRRLDAEAIRDALLFVERPARTGAARGLGRGARAARGWRCSSAPPAWTPRTRIGRSTCPWSATGCSSRSPCSTSPTRAS